MIYVIGDRGYVGKNLCETLSKAQMPFTGASNLGGREFLDILRPQTFDNLTTLKDGDHLVLLPWHVSGNYWEDPINIQYLAGYKILLLRLKELKLKINVVIAGTGVEVHGERHEITSVYAETKRQLSNFCKETASNGLNITWVRIFHTFGRFECKRRLIPLLIEAAQKKEWLELKNPNKIIHLNDIQFTCDVVASLLTKPAKTPYKIVNVTTGRVVRISDIAEYIHAIASGSPKKLVTHRQQTFLSEHQLVASQAVIDTNNYQTLDDAIRKHIEHKLVM